jgi:hypothetical protein
MRSPVRYVEEGGSGTSKMFFYPSAVVLGAGGGVLVLRLEVPRGDDVEALSLRRASGGKREGRWREWREETWHEGRDMDEWGR